MRKPSGFAFSHGYTHWASGPLTKGLQRTVPYDETHFNLPLGWQHADIYKAPRQWKQGKSYSSLYEFFIIDSVLVLVFKNK